VPAKDRLVPTSTPLVAVAASHPNLRHFPISICLIRRFLTVISLAGNYLCNEHLPFAVNIYARILIIFCILSFASSQASVCHSDLADGRSASARLLKTYTPATQLHRYSPVMATSTSSDINGISIQQPKPRHPNSQPIRTFQEDALIAPSPSPSGYAHLLTTFLRLGQDT
jgi:hypothetical protein